MPAVAVPSHDVSFIYIYIPGQLGFISFLIVQSYGVHKHSSTWRPDGSTCFLAYYTTSLSLLCICVWMHWIFKMLIRYILSSVCLILSQFSQLSFMIYMGLCVFSLPISLMMILRIWIFYLILIIRLEVWPISHCLGLGHETMVGAVCLSILYIYIYPPSWDEGCHKFLLKYWFQSNTIKLLWLTWNVLIKTALFDLKYNKHVIRFDYSSMQL